MSEIGKFQLPPIRGTDVFPETMQSPPIVHMSVEYRTDPDRAYRPEVLEDYAKQAFAQHAPVISNYVLSQRQNYNAGVVPYMKHSQSHPEYDVSYSNNQGLHEIVTVNLRVDIARFEEEKKKEEDPLMLMILHDGNTVSAIPMSALNNLGTAMPVSHICEQSFWGGSEEPYMVTQVRVADHYSAICSELDISQDQVVVAMCAVTVQHDVADLSLKSSAFTEDYPHVFNGSGNLFYTSKQNFSYDPDYGISVCGGDSKGGSAVDANGRRYQGEFSELDWTFYNLTFKTGSSRKASPAVVTSSEMHATKGTYEETISYSGSQAITNYTPLTSGQCGSMSNVTMMPVSNEKSKSYSYIKSATFKGVSLGTATLETETKVTPNPPTDYIATVTFTHIPLPVYGVHPPPPKGDYASVGPVMSGSGTRTAEFVSGPDTYARSYDTTYYAPTIGCGVTITYLDIAAGGLFGSSNESVDGAMASLAASTQCSGLCISMEVKTVRGPVGGGATTETKVKITNGTDGANAYVIPYGIDGQIYWSRQPSKGPMTYYLASGKSRTVSNSFGLAGYFNLSNGEHILQMYAIPTGTNNNNAARNYTLEIDKTDVGSQLAALIGTSLGNINAIFMDIHMSKIEKFK